MKRFFLLAAVAFLTIAAMAQDVIVTRDGKRVDAKITEVSSTEIRYKEWSNQDGPTFVLRNDEINTIIYQNGTVKTFDHSTAAPAQNNTVTYTPAPAASTTPAGFITKNDDYYTLGTRRMSEDEYFDYIRANCQDAWEYYQSGCKLWSAGWKLFGCGLGFITVGAVLCGVGNTLYWYQGDINYDAYLGMYIPGCIILGAGSGCLAASVPCLIVGSIRRNNSHEEYNDECAKRNTAAITFGIKPAPGGLGVAMNF